MRLVITVLVAAFAAASLTSPARADGFVQQVKGYRLTTTFEAPLAPGWNTMVLKFHKNNNLRFIPPQVAFSGNLIIGKIKTAHVETNWDKEDGNYYLTLYSLDDGRNATVTVRYWVPEGSTSMWVSAQLFVNAHGARDYLQTFLPVAA